MRIYIYTPKEIFANSTVLENLRFQLHDALTEFYGEFAPSDIKFLVSMDNNISVYIMEEALRSDSSGRIINAIRDIIGSNALIRLNYQKLNPDFNPDNYSAVQSVKTEKTITESPQIYPSMPSPQMFSPIKTELYYPSCSLPLTNITLLNLVKERFASKEVKEVVCVELRSIPEKNFLVCKELFLKAISEGYTHVIAAIGYNGEIIEGSIEWITDQNRALDPVIRQLFSNGSVIITR